MENVIKVDNLENLSNYPSNQKIKYICPGCHKERINYVSNFGLNKPLLCNYCKARSTWKQKSKEETQAIHEKKKETMKKHFGEDYFDIINEKRKKTSRNRDWSEKLKKQEQTCLEKYGVKNPGAWKEGKLKACKTSQLRYGADHYQQCEEAKIFGTVWEGIVFSN